MEKRMKDLRLGIIIFVAMIGVGIWRYFATGSVFYLFNFPFIGFSLFLGGLINYFLPKPKRHWGRRITMLMIGSYLFIYVGIILKENLQFEGFLFYLLSGLFIGSTLHYLIAKIAGPVIFNRGWCGWCCWTAMVLDILPWKKSRGRYRYYGVIRYLHFIVAVSFVLFLWFSGFRPSHYDEMLWFALGNILYYVIGIILAVILKDNRAFCKYVCPIPVIMKIGSTFSLVKLKVDSSKCAECGTCEKNCPMDVKILTYKKANKRILSSECILCMTCMNLCPKDAIEFSNGFDAEIKDRLNYK